MRHACCRCNRSGFLRDVCVKEGRTCTGCLPGRLGYCQNSTTASTGLQPAHESIVPSLYGQSSTILSTNPTATNSHVGLPSLSMDDSLNDALYGSCIPWMKFYGYMFQRCDTCLKLHEMTKLAWLVTFCPPSPLQCRKLMPGAKCLCCLDPLLPIPPKVAIFTGVTP